MTLMPSAARRRSGRRCCRRVPMSTPAVGSQSTSTGGRWARQRAITTFCWLPPLRVVIGARRPALAPRAARSTPRRAHAPGLGGVGRGGGGGRSGESERFSPTENSAITPSVCRSAGTRGMSELAASRDVVPLVGAAPAAGSAARPGRRACPQAAYGRSRGRSRPGRRCRGSRPPGLEVDAAQPAAVDPASLQSSRGGRPGRPRRPGSRGRCRRRPSAGEGRASSGADAGRCPTRRPPRRTVTRSASAKISSIRCET